MNNNESSIDQIFERIDKLNEIGIALSSEKDSQRLLETILQGAKALTNADGGTLYTVTEDQHLKFEFLSNDSLNIAMGGTTGTEIPFAPIPLYLLEGRSPNTSTVVTSAVLHDQTINIPDAYNAEGFDFSGTRKIDEQTNYRTQSILTIPMKNHEGDIIGVLQLINAIDEGSGDVVPFSPEDQRLAESLASQAAVALTNKRLIDDLNNLFESLIRLVATAIDEKSPYTGGHCKRVPVLTMMLAEAASKSDIGDLKNYVMTEKDRYELEVAAWLHDCGKITTPEFVMDKATKLESIFDRIHVVEERFEILRRDAKIKLQQYLLECANSGDGQNDDKEQEKYKAFENTLKQEMEFLRKCNIGSELMAEADQRKVEEISERTYSDINGVTRGVLNDDEVYNLNIAKGTLTPEERKVINNHVVVTIKMLESLPFPKHLRNVPEYAGGHHETMDGKGYPRGLTRDEMPVPARVMAIADIFEALTARDRPYKKGKTLTECMQIMGRMQQNSHIDPDLFKLFVEEKIYLKYAERFLNKAQIDEVDHAEIPGYSD